MLLHIRSNSFYKTFKTLEQYNRDIVSMKEYKRDVTIILYMDIIFKCPTVGELCPALGWVTNVPSILGLLGGRGQSCEVSVLGNEKIQPM
jgi:hypothetical protein